MPDTISSISLNSAKIQFKEQSRGRMKIVIKLDKAEAEGYINFKNSILPTGASEEEFVKTVFYMGLGQFHENAMNMMKKYVEENEETLRKDGVDVDALRSLGNEMTESKPTEPE